MLAPLPAMQLWPTSCCSMHPLCTGSPAVSALPLPPPPVRAGAAGATCAPASSRHLLGWVLAVFSSPRAPGVTQSHISSVEWAGWLAWCAERQYKGVTSPPVPLNLQDLSLDRTQAAQQAAAAGSQQPSSGANGAAAGGQGKGGKAGGAQDVGASEGAALSSEHHARQPPELAGC